MLCCVTAEAEDDDKRWLIQTSVYTKHFSPRPEHNNDQDLIGLEYTLNPDEDFRVGGATFLNSYGQRSTYAYMGWRFDHDTWPVYAKLTAGLLHGYRGEYQDNIPLNRYGVAPAILPSVGVQVGFYSGELVVFGGAGMMINTGVNF